MTILKYIFTLLNIVFFVSFGMSQSSNMLNTGSVTFERKINLFANKNYSAEYKKQNNQFRTTYYELYFTQDKTAFIPSNVNQQLDRIGIQPAENNFVYTEQTSKTYQSKKSIFDEIYVVEDSLPKIAWKITSEKRVIAGFECRRANALIFDSIYVVAFYTDDIPVSAGPELFGGLPGMILGISLPHLHINIFATNVSGKAVSTTLLERIKPRQSPISANELRNRLIKSLPFQSMDETLFLIQSLL